MFCTSKENLHSFFNTLVSEKLNGFFSFITNLGDGIVVMGSLLLLLFINVRIFLNASLTYAFASGLTQYLKLYPFDDVVRPMQRFADLGLKLKLILPDSEMLGRNSFPSGHSTAAFSLFFTLALCTQKKWLQAISFFTALLIAFSRVYLSQHFFEDIYAGASIAVFFSIIFYYTFYFSSFSGKFNKLEAPLLKILFASKKNV